MHHSCGQIQATPKPNRFDRWEGVWVLEFGWHVRFRGFLAMMEVCWFRCSLDDWWCLTMWVSLFAVDCGTCCLAGVDCGVFSASQLPT